MRWPSITDQVVISGGQAVTKRHPTCPTGRAVASLAEGEPAHRAVDSVRADHEVVFARGAVAELDRDASRFAR